MGQSTAVLREIGQKRRGEFEGGVESWSPAWRTYVTPADALHLATAAGLQEQHAWLPLVFVSADAKLVRLASAEALYVFNPLLPADSAIRMVRPKYQPAQPIVGYTDS